MMPTRDCPSTSTQRALIVPLAGFIGAMRWGAVTSADPEPLPGAVLVGVTVEAYQLEPLRRR